METAIILLSGGVDSCVVLALAKERGLNCIGLSFDYGQRHRVELKAAAKIAAHYNIQQKIIKIDPAAFSNSSLTSLDIDVAKDRSATEIATGGIPLTYVPARNTIFISYAIGQAEIADAQEIHVGFNALDHNAYPDCRPAFLEAFQSVLNAATRQAIEGTAPKIRAPLLQMDKAAIFNEGKRLNAPLALTFSCYDPTVDEHPCGRCDACILRIGLL